MCEAVLLKAHLFQGPAGECTKTIVGVRKSNSGEQPGDQNAPTKQQTFLERHFSRIFTPQKSRSKTHIRRSVEYRRQQPVNLPPVMLTVGVEVNGYAGTRPKSEGGNGLWGKGKGKWKDFGA